MTDMSPKQKLIIIRNTLSLIFVRGPEDTNHMSSCLQLLQLMIDEEASNEQDKAE